MPIFKNVDNIKENNILFIHIPKTGGSSIETYFIKKCESNNKNDMLITPENTNFIKLGKSAQHLEYKTIMENKDILNLDTCSFSKIITIVRNPYTRIISELFWNKSINNDMNANDVFNVLLNILNKYKDNNNIYDNHIRPQYQFIIDNNGKINKDIIILRNEKLNEMMHHIGYTDFNEKAHVGSTNINYFKYLNRKSIHLINKFYKNDFLCFGYKIIRIK